jgi:hypothetical protein
LKGRKGKLVLQEKIDKGEVRMYINIQMQVWD